MKYIDISREIFTGMKKYPSDPDVEIRQVKSLKKGNSCNLLKVTLGNHTGTHIDAPRHIFYKADTVDNIKIKDLICDVIVVDAKRLSEPAFFKKANLKKIKGVLIKKGKNSGSLTLKEANILIKNKAKIIGVEAMTIEATKDKSHPVHRLLLKRKVIIIEGLDLKRVRPGCYKLICLPLKIRNADGAPARAILVK